MDLISRARALTPVLAAAAPRIEAAGELPPDVLDALHDAGLFRMLLPRSLGGAETDLPTFFQAVCALAEGDASAAWCLVQNCGCSMAAAYLAPEVARRMFGGPRDVLAWGFPAAPARALAAEREGKRGWLVTGTWAFGSGSRHAGWLGGHCTLFDAEGNPRLHADGRAMERTMLFARAAARIRGDQWRVIGLRGTGSDTYSVDGLFVPEEYSVVPRGIGRDQPHLPGVAVENEPERSEAGALFRQTGTNVYQCGFAAVGLGIARAMLASFIALAMKKAPSAASVPLKDDHRIQSRIAQSEARLSSARAFLLETLRDMAAQAALGPVSFEQRIRLRLASTHAIHEARQVVEDAYADAGATAIFESQPFERRLRDMHAVSQQVQASAAHFQSVGQYYLGIPPNNRFI